ncbi:hypothetical protein ACLB2K_038257 [Fragaria x ananassa]
MAFRSSMLVLLVAMALCGTCSGAAAGAAYEMGGPDGWIIGTDYHQWSSKEFHVGDTLLFSYSPYHNVIEVTKQGFESCDPSSPIAAYDSGSDSITLERPGHYYFLCGIPGHCNAGQKVEVVVSSLPTPVDNPVSSLSPAPSGLASPSTPSPAPSSPLSTPSTPSPAPSAFSSPSSTPIQSSSVLSSPSTPSPAPSGLSTPSTPSPAPSPSTPHPQERPPHSAATTINSPKLALALYTFMISCMNLMKFV